TMFTEDVFAHYGGKERFGEKAQVQTGRLFVVILTLIAYAIALEVPQGIFDVAVQYAFTGYAALCPVLVAALFWKRSTKWGALAATLSVVAGVVAVAGFQHVVPAPPPGPPIVVWTVAGVALLARTAGGTSVAGFLPVVPMVLVSSLLVVLVSFATPPPSAATIARYFPD